jgi:type II secretory pathway pseudopilin PulG
MEEQGVRRTVGRRAVRAAGTAGFTFLELLVALSLFAAVSILILHSFIAGMSHAGRANEQAAATSLAVQVMEQVRASADPWTMVGYGPVARTPLASPAWHSTPYAGIVNPTPHAFDVAVAVARNNDLGLATVTVNVYRPTDSDGSPIVWLTTVLDDQ